MKQNRKGFTLIELLAVIVILAIIALIATPIILNMINEARRSSAKSSTLGFVDSIEYYAGFSEANAAGGMDLSGYGVAVPGAGTCTKTSSGWKNGNGITAKVTVNGSEVDACKAFMEAVEAKSKGKAPDEATAILDAAGKVQASSTFKFGKLNCTYDGTDVTKCE